MSDQLSKDQRTVDHDCAEHFPCNVCGSFAHLGKEHQRAVRREEVNAVALECAQASAVVRTSKPRDECQHGSLRRQCEICERDETIERLQRENDRLSRNVIGAYEAGWLTAANWMERDDLGADIGSPAYCADRDKALVALPAVETSTHIMTQAERDAANRALEASVTVVDPGFEPPDPLASKNHDLAAQETSAPSYPATGCVHHWNGIGPCPMCGLITPL